MISSGLAASEQAIFDLDFHAVMHWGHDPALEKHYVPKRSGAALLEGLAELRIQDGMTPLR